MDASFPVYSLWVGWQFEYSTGMLDPATNNENYYREVITECKYMEWHQPQIRRKVWKMGFDNQKNLKDY